MWMTKSAGALERRIAQENVEQGTTDDPAPYATGRQLKNWKYEGRGRSNADVQAGKFEDPKIQDSLIAEIATLTSAQCLAESTNRKRTAVERAVFRQAATLKLAEEQKKAAKPKASAKKPTAKQGKKAGRAKK
jgi:hypothetical protein